MSEFNLGPQRRSTIRLCSILFFLCYCLFFKNSGLSLRDMAFINFICLKYLMSLFLSLLFIIGFCDKLTFLHKNKLFLLIYEILYFILGMTEGMLLAALTVGLINLEIRWNLVFG